MAAPEPSELGELSRAAAGLVDVVAETVEETHRGIAGRAFGSVGPLGAPVRMIHDQVSGAVYRAVRLGLHGVGTGFGTIADRHPDLRRLRPLSTRRGARTLAAVNGIVGDRIARDHPRLDPGLHLWHDGHRLEVERDGLERAFPDATGDLVVFLHGLCESERSWWRPSRSHRRAAGEGEPLVISHGEGLAEAHGLTPLYVHYNTGRRLPRNGADLAELLETLVDAWPSRVRRLALVGHSMGGLVVRSAAHIAVERGHRWPDLVDDIAYLGTPHLGAPLARGVAAAGEALSRLPETRGFTGLLANRSEGVEALVNGEIVESEAQAVARAPERSLRETAGDPPPLPGARHHLLVATVTRDPAHPLGRLLGDAMVGTASGSGRSRRRDLGLGDDVVVLGGLDHFDLLSDPRVTAQLVEWLAPDG